MEVILLPKLKTKEKKGHGILQKPNQSNKSTLNLISQGQNERRVKHAMKITELFDIWTS